MFAWSTPRDVTENYYSCCPLRFSRSWNLEWWPTQRENESISRHLPSQHCHSDIHSTLLHLSWTEVDRMSPTENERSKVSPAWLFCSPPCPSLGQFVSTVQKHYGVLTRNRCFHFFGYCWDGPAMVRIQNSKTKTLSLLRLVSLYFPFQGAECGILRGEPQIPSYLHSLVGVVLMMTTTRLSAFMARRS